MRPAALMLFVDRKEWQALAGPAPRDATPQQHEPALEVAGRVIRAVVVSGGNGEREHGGGVACHPGADDAPSIDAPADGAGPPLAAHHPGLPLGAVSLDSDNIGA